MVGRRRSYAKSFKAQVVEECAQPGASVAGVALRHGLNANLVHKWRGQARSTLPAAQAGFIPIPLPASVPTSRAPNDSSIRVEIPHHAGRLAVHWPSDDPAGCARFVRELLR
jgi:transposase